MHCNDLRNVFFSESDLNASLHQKLPPRRRLVPQGEVRLFLADKLAFYKQGESLMRSIQTSSFPFPLHFKADQSQHSY